MTYDKKNSARAATSDNLALMREAADALSELLEVANRSEPGMDNVKRFVRARCSARTTLDKLRDEIAREEG